MPGFVRGVELLRLGLGSEARREFAAVGIVVPDSKDSPVAKDPAQSELLWLASVLYERAGDWHRSHFIPRHLLQSWQRHYPVGPWRSYWQLAYPRGYAELLTSAAQQNGIPEALQFAIVREESAFDPLTESFANAIGLTQMIPSTAKRFAAGQPWDRQALRDPAQNVAIGSRFLGFLWQVMNHHPALAVSGYNAGESAVWRWLRNYADLQEIDLFIEAIPFDETRGYTKRVLSSFLTYRWLAPPPAGTPLQLTITIRRSRSGAADDAAATPRERCAECCGSSLKNAERCLLIWVRGSVKLKKEEPIFPRASIPDDACKERRTRQYSPVPQST
jgi:soluble lytic murein transglycosylase